MGCVSSGCKHDWEFIRTSSYESHGCDTVYGTRSIWKCRKCYIPKEIKHPGKVFIDSDFAKPHPPPYYTTK